MLQELLELSSVIVVVTPEVMGSLPFVVQLLVEPGTVEQGQQVEQSQQPELWPWVIEAWELTWEGTNGTDSKLCLHVLVFVDVYVYVLATALLACTCMSCFF